MNTLIEPDDHKAHGPDNRRGNGMGGTGRMAAAPPRNLQARMRRSLGLLALLGAAWLAPAGSSALAQTVVPAAQKPFPVVSLPQRARGDNAVKALGGRLPEVAAWYGMSTQAFARMLREDRHAWLDQQGRLLYIDDFEPPPEPIGEVANSANISGAVPAPLDQTFLLHSRPGAKRVIYLDFKGGTVTNTAWNTSYGVSAIDAKPFDLDGNLAAFNDTELQRIQYIWQRVAEDYAPFNVDVTTEAPPADALLRNDSNDDTFGTRVMITQDWTSLTASPCGCGGIAYVGIYDYAGEQYKPAWVFYNKLGSGNEKYVAEAISHEAGHNLGLSHDGTSTTGYYSGHGSGATGWAPIMGVGYYKELSQWSKGEYTGATQFQDDLAVMQIRGAPLMADDHADTGASATLMDAVELNGAMSLSASGLIGTRNDVDMFRFAMGAGNLALNLTAGTRGPNLDISAGLYDGSGSLLASANPADALGASFNLSNLPAGTYYLRVDGTGKGDLSTGYSDYGSLGEYFITGSTTAPSGMPPVAMASATPTSGGAPLLVNFSSTGSYDPDGGALIYDWDFGDGTPHASTASASHTYASGTYTARLTVTDPSGNADQATLTITVAAPPPVLHVDNIAMSTSTNRSKGTRATARVTVKDAAGVVVPGARVSGSWSGAVSGNLSSSTGSNGIVSFTSAYSKASPPLTFTFTVTGISLNGYTYDASQNTETSDSVTR